MNRCTFCEKHFTQEQKIKNILKRKIVKILLSLRQKQDQKLNLKNLAKQMKVHYCIIADF